MRQVSELSICPIEMGDPSLIDQVVDIHVTAFPGFFLSFMGPGFLKQMYHSYCEHDGSGIIVAYCDDRPVGFLSYSLDMSGLYKFMIRRRLLKFGWYAFGAFLRKPTIALRLLRSFLKPSESSRSEKYVELSSIAVRPDFSSGGIGTALISELKNIVEGSDAEYISLETDAVNNEAANSFYLKNGFVLSREYVTPENRRMNEYRFALRGLQ